MLKAIANLFAEVLHFSFKLTGSLLKFANTRTRRLGVLVAVLVLFGAVTGVVSGWIIGTLVLATFISWAFDRWGR